MSFEAAFDPLSGFSPDEAADAERDMEAEAEAASSAAREAELEALDASAELFGTEEDDGGDEDDDDIMLPPHSGGAGPSSEGAARNRLSGGPSSASAQSARSSHSARSGKINTRSLTGRGAARSPHARVTSVLGSDEENSQSGWGGHGDHVQGRQPPHPYLGNAVTLDQIAERDRRARAADADADGAASRDGSIGLRSHGDELMYDDFDINLLRAPGQSKPLLLAQDEVWKLVPSLGPDEMRPKRAVCLSVITDFFKRDAELFNNWQLPKGHKPRCKATAAILSLLFAGTYQGLPSGKHEEKMRNQAEPQTEQGGGKSKVKPLNKVTQYTYAPQDDESDSWPMFQIGIEEVYNYDQRDVVALRVWLFVYDETHSTSQLMRRVVDTVNALHASQCAGAEAPELRSKNLVSETSRRDKAGMGFGELDANFEGTVGMQYSRIRTSEDWHQMLALHSGKTTDGPGRPCVANLSEHLNCPSGRRKLEGDLKTGCGSRHPAAAEFLLNGKRREALAFGLVDLDGVPIDVCEEQLDPNQYWQGDGCFRVPQLERSCFWICTSPDRRSVFGMPLARPLQGTVVPGDHMTRLAIEMERRARNLRDGAPAEAIDPETIDIDQNAYNRIRSLMTRKDEHQRKQDQLMRSTLKAHDLMTPGVNAAAGGELLSGGVDDEGDQNFTIRVTAMTKRVAEESDRFYTQVITPWKSAEEAALNVMNRAMLKAAEGEDDGEAEARRDEYWSRRSSFQARFYNVKKDLTQYHLKLMRTCFLSSKDAATLPAGYTAMYRALEKGVAENGGSASIAFNGGVFGRGRQLMCKDRLVWGSLQEWLRCVFVDDCKIEGRDRRLMDEIYLHAFEMYADTTFVLIIAADKGTGKSVRAMRMAYILPEDWCSNNSATSARAGMNGNNSPSNGKVTIYDEMLADMTPAECTERMEYYKTIVGKREYEIERTQSVKNADGTERHVTFKIVTDHHETFLICCNMGQCFTSGDEEPTSGKQAMIQRTVCLQARAEADSDSSWGEFTSNLKEDQPAANNKDFRLFTALCGYVRLAMKGLDWLQPDFAMANLIFKAGDEMLTKEYGMPRSEPRRLVKRTENLKTMCVHEAVARVYFFKQTAVEYEAGVPDAQGHGKKFDVADLWDVLRTMRPTREMILAAWSHSLEYSIGTSSHGCNVMTAICEKLGLYVDTLFRRVPTESAQELMSGSGTEELRQWMTENCSRHGTALGASQQSLNDVEAQLREARKLRYDFRHRAMDRPQSSQPMQAIRSIVGDKDAKRYANALFPSLATCSLYYKPKALLTWASGRSVELSGEPSSGHKKDLRFRQSNPGGDQGGAKRFDFAWLVLHNQPGDRTLTWNSVATKIKDQPNAQRFDMHLAGVADAMKMLSSSENVRCCPEQPRVSFVYDPSKAFVDENGSIPNDRSTHLSLRGVEIQEHDDGTPPRLITRGYSAHEGRPLGVRPPGSKFSVHEQLDHINQNGRLPAMQPLMSTNLKRHPPLRRCTDAAQTIEVNSACAYEHVNMLIEAVLVCSRVPGLRGLQERFTSGGPGAAPNGLRSDIAGSNLSPSRLRAEYGVADSIELVHTLPYSIDIMQLAWTHDLAARFYNPLRTSAYDQFNDHVESQELGSPLTKDDVPELTTRYPGFPLRADRDKTEALRLVSVATSAAKPDGQACIDVASASPLQDIDTELLRYETEIAIGGPASETDIESHRKTLIGSGYTWGTKGDVFSYVTWMDHLQASMMGRGNTDGLLDADGRVGDAAFRASLDAEFMILPRLREREWAKGKLQYKLSVVPPGGSTYRYLEKNPILGAGASGEKRAREEAPRAPFTATAAAMSMFGGAAVEKTPAPTRRLRNTGGGRSVEEGDSRTD